MNKEKGLGPDEKNPGDFVKNSVTVKKEKIMEEKKAMITFRYNRKFDLHVGRVMITFMGRETKPIPETWLQHKDFKQVKNYFVVKEVKNA